ncbi:sulfatase family protein [Spirochaeta isovalerica]|uniref:Choline-sulfatase n=1 Tax=Spirochaeta isovalerica TaxID=150 RepID=A0A841REX8_9SPIO|nr:sulfatase-like hydrolase/transferase [Spirochaeta isovalerica]MBB6481158.1 choline-sulfatase [Spirochaeta isovalerica]
MSDKKPNILYIMCDQFRYDAIAALGNSTIRTPNLDRLVERGVSYSNAYSPCPVCIPARYSIRTGRDSFTTGCYSNELPRNTSGHEVYAMEDWTGEFLPRTMSRLGYRTFGIGKFHTYPDQYEVLGYETHIHTEEMWDDHELRDRDGFARFLTEEHPEFNYLEQLHGERTNMYYAPQLSSLPAHLTVEGFVADKTIEQLKVEDDRPYFGLVSFIGPHPPCAPPIPYNRMYDPDGMSNPVKGRLEDDHLDEQIPWMNYIVYADEINDAWARNLKTRYYGEISYIDDCIGRILDEVEKRPDADDTLICFFTDHGDMLGDHHAWQKECFYEASVKIPFLLSYPGRLKGNSQCDDLVSLTDLFGLATKVGGAMETRDGIDILDDKRDVLYAFHGRPGARQFKLMVRHKNWKYIYMANGGREQLFDLESDPDEMTNLAGEDSEILNALRSKAVEKCLVERDLNCMVDQGRMKGLPFEARPLGRLHQFAFSKGITEFIVPSGNNFISESLPNTTE